MTAASKNREIYLNDHLAGSESALDLLQKMSGSSDARLAAFARDLHAEVDADRDQLEAVLARFEVSRERVKLVLASLMESASRLALARPGASEELTRLLELETISGGIWAKKQLWRTLLAAPSLRASLTDIDLEELEARAGAQLDRVVEEHQRIAAAAVDDS